ncbi:DUF5996 family protein [Brevundimonas lutea]|uniref:DUF5996 family protein n=1 Tax=Brevundimonas lutea TaxID=2293980 RepID=UPI000F024400|nr:DUF5996 family protein [Brevundimonas lutea]
MSGTDATLWPDLTSPTLDETARTLQLWSQIVGKVRLRYTPWVNHSWHATLYVSARGLTTSLFHIGDRAVEMEFDVVDGALVIRDAAGPERRIALVAGGIADFHAQVRGALAEMGLEVTIDDRPNEIPDAVPFSQDRAPRSYDPAAAVALWRALVRIDRVFNAFRTRFLGKSSPVHLFWGSFDLAVTRFSGRRAPPHPGGIPNLPDAVTREAYSHEVASAGFWPGGAGIAPSFYAYAYPTPAGYAEASIRPDAARFDTSLGEFLLPYEAVRTAPDPEAMLLDFLQSAYEAAADLAAWDRHALDCDHGRHGSPRKV